MKPSLCLEMVFRGLPFAERIEAAARAGYPAIEFWDWRNKNLDEVRAAADGLGVEVAAFSGNRVCAMANPAEKAGFLEEVKRSLDAAVAIGGKTLMLLTDRLTEDGSAAPLPDGLSEAEKRESVAEALAAAAAVAAGSGVTLALEPLNTKLDHKGYFLDRAAAGLEIVRRVNSPAARLLYDAYHMSMMGEDPAAVIGENLEWIGHIHAADMPGRHEPGSGRIKWRRLVKVLRSRKYTGFVGMEFSPSGDSESAAAAALRLFQ